MSRPLNILLVEDDAIEVMKFNRVVKNLETKHKITEANNGEEALNLLKDRTVNPDIIILDLNMPKVNGLEFLKIIKQDDNRKFIPTIILTTSNNFTDIKECYQNGIAGYVVKPLKHDDYMTSTKKLLEYWSSNELIS
ncbi:response regulator [Flavobacterium psychrotrophum]|uniref:response regulator n=1 Tax=Flavobacterium psychrotrophum TaxID=2294119 RepID=UPI000E31FC13|nr:response regulator [Flavobacterium psychrotrophum]